MWLIVGERKLFEKGEMEKRDDTKFTTLRS